MKGLTALKKHPAITISLYFCFLFLPKLLFQMTQTLLEAIQIFAGPVLTEDTTKHYIID